MSINRHTRKKMKYIEGCNPAQKYKNAAENKNTLSQKCSQEKKNNSFTLPMCLGNKIISIACKSKQSPTYAKE